MSTTLKRDTFGVMFRNGRYYKSNSDKMLTPFCVPLKYMSSVTIPHFFVWDNYFDRINTKEKFSTFLNGIKSAGVKYVCQTDFSCWYHYDKQRRENIVKNFNYYSEIISHGLSPILNYNTIFHDYFDLYKSVLLPEHYAIVMDLNHSEDKYINYEYRNFVNLLNLTKTKNLIIITDKKPTALASKYSAIIDFAASHGIRTVQLPTQLSMLRAIRENRKRKTNEKPT